MFGVALPIVTRHVNLGNLGVVKSLFSMWHAPKLQGCAESRCGLALCMRCKHRPGIVADATLLRVLARLARWVWVVRMALTLQP